MHNGIKTRSESYSNPWYGKIINGQREPQYKEHFMENASLKNVNVS